MAHVPLGIDDLAPELVDTILLSVETVRDLGALISSSRYVLRCFESRKRTVLFRVLQTQLGPVLPDALFLQRFPYARPGYRIEDQTIYWDKIHDCAAIYRRMLGVGGPAPPLTKPTLEELMALCRTLRDISLLANIYLETRVAFFRTCDRSVDEVATVAGAPPSRVEQLRVLRAFYRRQIVCNAWAPTRRSPLSDDMELLPPQQQRIWHVNDTVAMGNTHEQQSRRLGLFSAFEPWEMQQLEHANFFVYRLCSALCLVGWRAGYPVRLTTYGDLFSHTDYLVDYLLQRPVAAEAALAAVCQLPRSGGPRPLNDAASFHRYAGCYSIGCLRSYGQVHRYYNCPDPIRDQLAHPASERAYTEFSGDAVGLPPFGWLDAVAGQYMNWYGEALRERPPHTPVDKAIAHVYTLYMWRDAGLALWDRRRVEAIKMLSPLRGIQTGWLAY